MRNICILLAFFLFLSVLSLQAFDYVPKDANSNPFAEKKQNVSEDKITTKEIREIKNLNEYFKYLPIEVHKNWIPYKANVDYTVTVEFMVRKDGSISETQIVKSDYSKANLSVLNAVKEGAPYLPLPKSYPNDSVKAQIILEYHSK